MKENQILWIGEAALAIFILIVVSAIAIVNIIRGNVPHPRMLLIVAVGFIFFAVAKASVFKRGTLFSIGTKGMSQAMANLYRVGSWLIFVGCLFTFVK
jgi:hypothetical protein